MIAFLFIYSFSFPLGCYKRQPLEGATEWMMRRLFSLTNCHRVVSENAVNEGLSVFVSMATAHTTADLHIVITHYPQSNSLCSNLVYFSVASLKGKTKR